MAHADHVDKTALTFVIVMTIFIAVLAYTIFPRHEAPTAPPSAAAAGRPRPARRSEDQRWLCVPLTASPCSLVKATNGTGRPP